MKCIFFNTAIVYTTLISRAMSIIAISEMTYENYTDHCDNWSITSPFYAAIASTTILSRVRSILAISMMTYELYRSL